MYDCMTAQARPRMQRMSVIASFQNVVATKSSRQFQKFAATEPSRCGRGVWGGGTGASRGKNIFLYNSSVVRVSASYSSDLTLG